MSEKESKLLVSIVVPVYNGERYLNECLESIVKQTYVEWELLIINDGSTDGSLTIMNSWAEEDSRIRIFSQTNKGLSAARNVGLQNRLGDVIAFVDCDDYLDKNYLEKTVSKMQSASADVVCFGFYKLYQDQNVPVDKFPQEERVFTPKEFLEKFYTYPSAYGVVWNRIYRSWVFEDVLFKEGIINEDSYIMSVLFSKDMKIVYIPELLYYYRKRKSSIMGTRSERVAISGSEWVREHVKLHERNGNIDLYHRALKLYTYTLAENYILRTKTNRKQARNELKECTRKMLFHSSYGVRIKLKVLYMFLFTKQYSLQYNKSISSTHVYFE